MYPSYFSVQQRYLEMSGAWSSARKLHGWARCTWVDVPRHRRRYNSGGGSFSGTLSGGLDSVRRWREVAARWKEKRWMGWDSRQGGREREWEEGREGGRGRYETAWQGWGCSGCRGCLMQDGCSGSQRLSRLQTRVREEIQLVAELPNVKETPHGGWNTRSSSPRCFLSPPPSSVNTLVHANVLPRRSLSRNYLYFVGGVN